MSNVAKKRKKLQDRITELETSLQTALVKKSSSAAEVNVPATLRKIADLKADLSHL